MKESGSRPVKFESVYNFRDIGGYEGRDGRKVTRGRLFRSGELHHMSEKDISVFMGDLGIRSVIDLRDGKSGENAETGEIKNLDIRYFPMPLTIVSGGNKEYDDPEETHIFKQFSNCGEIYLYRLNTEGFGRNLVEVLDIIADRNNLPLVFHCSAGKDRTGVIAAMLLGILGVSDKDIVEDYAQTALYMEEIMRRWNDDPVFTEVMSNLQPYQLEAVPESMEIILSGIKKDYGSIRGYLLENGAEESLFERLEEVMLE